MKVASCALKRPQEVRTRRQWRGNQTEMHVPLQQLQVSSHIPALCSTPGYFSKNSSFRFNHSQQLHQKAARPLEVVNRWWKACPLIFQLHACTRRLHPHSLDVTANKWSVLPASGGVIRSTRSPLPFSRLTVRSRFFPHPPPHPSWLDHPFTPGLYSSHG